MDFMEYLRQVPVKAIWASVGLLGGIARMLNDVLIGREKFSWGRLTMKAVVSCFFGYMGGETAALLNQPEFAFMTAGLIGYLGSEGFDFVVYIFKKRNGIKE